MQTTCGRQILVDEADAAELCAFRWYFIGGYAAVLMRYTPFLLVAGITPEFL